MTLLSRDAALELADRVLALSRADETEVSVVSTVDRFVRFADSGPTQNADRERVDVAVRARLDGTGGLREARATAVGTDPGALEAAATRALELARVSPPDPEVAGLGGAVEVAETRGDRATLEHSMARKGEWVSRAVQACQAEDLQPAGLTRTTVHSYALVNSVGRAVHGFTNRASLSLTASSTGGSGIGNAIRASAADLDPEPVVRRAVEKARMAREPRAIEPGEYTVVLEPLAVSSILLFASYKGFGARELEEQESFLCGRLGEQAFSSGLSIADDAGNGVYAGLPFDGEGTPKQRVELIEAGVPRGVVTDRRWARKRGESSTGHGRAQPSAGGPCATNLVMAPGSESLEELIGGVERGLLISQFHYTNLIEPRELVLTGMTRNGTFAIENGRLVGAVKNLRFTESLAAALGRVSGISAEREVASALFEGEAVLPALRIEGFRFTSTTDF